MGHLRLGHLARTQRWKEVIRLLEDGAPLPDLANASLHASLTGLKRIPADAGFLATINAIVRLAEAARSKDVPAALSDLGIDPANHNSAFGFLSAVSKQVSTDVSNAYPRSDVGKIAHDSLVQALSQHLRSDTKSWFGASNEDAKSLTRPFRGVKFRSLMHEFYSRLTNRYLSYYLSRELPSHVGGGGRFANLESYAEFGKQFDLYCRQTVRIADEFTPGWVGKAVYESNVSSESVSRYAHVAFKKIASEFKKGAC